MSTRAQVRFATRELGVSFSEHPDKINAQFYVHHDGYPEGLGCQIAESLLNNAKLEGWELEHVDSKHGDLEYIYYVWSGHDKSIMISIFEDREYMRFDGSSYPQSRECIFVGTAAALLSKYDERHNEEPDDGVLRDVNGLPYFEPPPICDERVEYSCADCDCQDCEAVMYKLTTNDDR